LNKEKDYKKTRKANSLNIKQEIRPTMDEVVKAMVEA